MSIPERGCDECRDWYDNPLNSNRVTAAQPRCPARGGRCVRFPATEAELAAPSPVAPNCRGCGHPLTEVRTDATTTAAVKVLKEGKWVVDEFQDYWLEGNFEETDVCAFCGTPIDHEQTAWVASVPRHPDVDAEDEEEADE